MIAAALIASAVALIWQLRRRYLVVTVVGHSMMPTLRNGEKLVARRGRGAALARAQIVVFVPPLPPERRAARDVAYRIKRIVALAGDPAPPWLPRLAGGSRLTRVPPGMVAVLGDNPCSEDSRSYGCVPEASILARVRAPARGTSPGSPDLRLTARRRSP